MISGVIVAETKSALTVRTQTSTETIAGEEIDEIQISGNSFMPEAILNLLSERERIELFEFLMSR